MIEFEFRNVDFCRGRRIRRKTLEARGESITNSTHI
jgi:hypothetical protein